MQLAIPFCDPQELDRNVTETSTARYRCSPMLGTMPPSFEWRHETSQKENSVYMTTAINSGISPFAQPKPEPNANANRFLDEKLASVPASVISEGFRKLSRYLPLPPLVPKSAFPDVTTQKKPGLDTPLTRLIARDPSRLCMVRT